MARSPPPRPARKCSTSCRWAPAARWRANACSPRASASSSSPSCRSTAWKPCASTGRAGKVGVRARQRRANRLGHGQARRAGGSSLTARSPPSSIWSPVRSPRCSVDAVEVVDQHGRLLSSARPGDTDRLDLQARLEEKLRGQVFQLLTPMLGEGDFSSEIQVDLDMDQLTSARESYDKQGVVRSETQSASQSAGANRRGRRTRRASNTPAPPPPRSPARQRGGRASRRCSPSASPVRQQWRNLVGADLRARPRSGGHEPDPR